MSKRSSKKLLAGEHEGSGVKLQCSLDKYWKIFAKAFCAS